MLADIAQEHPAVVIEYAGQIAVGLADNNIQVRVIALIALQLAGEVDLAAIQAQQNR